jgi:hypothetical protein
MLGRIDEVRDVRQRMTGQRSHFMSWRAGEMREVI